MAVAILIPKFNKRDLDKLEANVKEGLTFHLVGDMEEVLALAFPEDKFKPGTGESNVNASPAQTPEEKLASAVAKAVAEVLHG